MSEIDDAVMAERRRCAMVANERIGLFVECLKSPIFKDEESQKRLMGEFMVAVNIEMAIINPELIIKREPCFIPSIHDGIFYTKHMKDYPVKK